MVARLKLQVQELKEELTMATGEERTDELTEEEKKRSGQIINILCLYQPYTASINSLIAF